MKRRWRWRLAVIIIIIIIIIKQFCDDAPNNELPSPRATILACKL
jgi:hypothetical protein